jgi:hypothetical protein
MTDVLFIIRVTLQLSLGIAAILWYPYEIGYRFYFSRMQGIGYWDVETPLWHKIVIWPIILGLFMIFTWDLLR